MWTEPTLAAQAPKGFALYLHTPFCRRKCPYCDFYSVESTDRDEMSRFIDAVTRELAARAHAYAGLAAHSIYLGGGTPSLVSPDAWQKMLECIHRRFPVAADAEITLEVNPGTVDKNTLGALRKIGINRLSVGVQSFDDEVLRFLGRIHNAATARRVLHEAREVGFDNLSLDLMLGAAAQSEASFQRDLDEITSLKPDHASVYMLTVEDGTPFGQRRAGGQDPALDDDLLATRYEELQQRLPDMGLLQYEISNFATEGRHSRHNLSYWNGSPYLGLGPAAHSFRYESNGQTALREANPEDLDAYLTHNFGQSPFAEVEAIDRETLRKEMIFCGLRTRWGLDFAAFAARHGQDLRRTHAEALEHMAELGFLTVDETGLRPTERGFRFADAIALEFF